MLHAEWDNPIPLPRLQAYYSSAHTQLRALMGSTDGCLICPLVYLTPHNPMLLYHGGGDAGIRQVQSVGMPVHRSRQV